MDAAKAVVAYLNARPDVVPAAYHEVPKDKPEEFIVVERTGGTVSGWGLVDAAEVAVRCWAATREAAARHAQDVVSALVEMPYERADAFAANVVSTSADRDPDDGAPRALVVAQMIFNE